MASAGASAGIKYIRISPSGLNAIETKALIDNGFFMLKNKNTGTNQGYFYKAPDAATLTTIRISKTESNDPANYPPIGEMDMRTYINDIIIKKKWGRSSNGYSSR